MICFQKVFLCWLSWCVYFLKWLCVHEAILKNKFSVEMCLCSIHDTHEVLMKKGDRFLFAIACWSFPYIQFWFLDKIVKSWFLNMNPSSQIHFSRISSPFLTCMASFSISQWKHFLTMAKTTVFWLVGQNITKMPFSQY